MEQKTVETFFYNIRWFNDFFSDMKSLFDKLSEAIEENTEYSERWLYYKKPNEYPQIPSIYFLGMKENESKYLQIISVFDDQYIKTEEFKIDEPSLFVIQHDHKDNSTWIGGNILQGYDTKDVHKKNEYIIGKLDYDPKVEFNAFKIPLEKFSQYKKEIVHEELISKLI